MSMIYKICPLSLWQDAERKGVFDGAEIDHTDGYIHFSTADQVRETAAKHFSAQTDLLLIAVDAAILGDGLKWEPSRGGALFPHLYASLTTSDVSWVKELPLASDGMHQFPDIS